MVQSFFRKLSKVFRRMEIEEGQSEEVKSPAATCDSTEAQMTTQVRRLAARKDASSVTRILTHTVTEPQVRDLQEAPT